MLTPVANKKRAVVTVKQKPKFALHIDADRDGKVDDNPNGLEKWEWGKGKKGAVVLVNNNGIFAAGVAAIDNEDDAVNGAIDLKDIAPLDIRRTGPTAPATWKATLSVDPKQKNEIRIFDSRTAGGKEIIGPTTGATYDLPDLSFDKKELGAEAVRYSGKDFDGLVTVTLTVKDDKSVLSKRNAVLRVAPWVMFHHLNAPEKVFVVKAADNNAFVGELDVAASAAGVPLQKVSGIPGDDRWMQDIMEFGFSQLPGQTPLRTVVETPRGRQLGGFPKKLLSDQLGYAMPAPVPSPGSSLDSGGNLECTPPFTSPKGKAYPFGRIYYCRKRSLGGRRDALAPGYSEFLTAQVVQRPMEVDSGWLAVGHVDEIISFVPAGTKRGFKLLLASPRLGLRLLDELNKDPANSGVKMLVGREYVTGISAEMSVSDFLNKGIDWVTPGDPDGSYKMSAKEIRQYNASCQSKIDKVEANFKAAMGLGKGDIDYVPIIYVHSDSGRYKLADALTAGMVNMLVLGKRCIAPRPFGPIAGGKDVFEEHYRSTLSGCGLSVEFVDDWDTYHVLKGEVHCGSNTLRKPDSSTSWWEYRP